MISTLTLRAWFSLCSIWFTGPRWWETWACILVSILVAASNTSLAVYMSRITEIFMTAMANRDHTAFWRAVIKLAMVASVAALLSSLSHWVQDTLKLAWRSQLTAHFCKAYFNPGVGLKLRLHSPGKQQPASSTATVNPDQQICEDVASFAQSTANLSIVVLQKVLTWAAFASVLHQVSGTLVVLIVSKGLLLTVISSTVFGCKLAALHNKVLACEGDMRSSFMRFKENAESIAFYRGEQYKSRSGMNTYHAVEKATEQYRNWAALYGLFTSIIAYASALSPYWLAAPYYFAGDIEFGAISRIAYACSSMETALTIITDNLAQITKLAAETTRLHNLLQAMHKQLPQGIEHTFTSERTQPAVTVKDLAVQLPGTDRAVCKALDVTLHKGGKILIMGPSGCGKSSLLRAFAGLWQQGCGTVHVWDSVLFLPQKPYMPQGSLRQQLLFPNSSHADNRDLSQVLKTVGLTHLDCQQDGGLTGAKDWSHILSLGEQQRVAIARLLVTKPDLAILDEATSATDVALEAALYEQIGKCCPTYISVGHRESLLQFHTRVLECGPDGQWRMYQIKDYNGLNSRSKTEQGKKER